MLFVPGGFRCVERSAKTNVDFSVGASNKTSVPYDMLVVAVGAENATFGKCSMLIMLLCSYAGVLLMIHLFPSASTSIEHKLTSLRRRYTWCTRTFMLSERDRRRSADSKEDYGLR